MGLTRNPEIGNTLRFANIWRLGRVRNTKFGTNISNKMWQNAAKCQGYSFYSFWVNKTKPTGGGDYPPAPRLGLRYYTTFKMRKFQSLSVSHPDAFWYHLSGIGAQKNAPKKVLVWKKNFSIHNSRKTWMKYNLQILKNKKLFKRLKYPSTNALKITYFWTLS